MKEALKYFKNLFTPVVVGATVGLVVGGVVGGAAFVFFSPEVAVACLVFGAVAGALGGGAIGNKYE